MGISGFFGKRNLSKLKINIEFPEEVFAGEEFPLKIVLENKKKFLPSFLIKINIDNKQVLIPYIENNGRYEKEILFIFENRGINKIENVHYCSVFPFNFFIRCFPIKKKFEKVVFPKPIKCKYFSHMEKRKRKQDEGKIRSYEGEIGGLKEYIQGEPLKYIHWKSYAKTGKLYTKELFSSGAENIVIDIDEIEEKNTEKKLSCATYLIIYFYKRKIPVGLKIKDKFLKPDLSYPHKISMLKELSLL